MPWAFKKFATASDPIHKSHLNAITGDFGCPKQFRYRMDERADGRHDHDDETRSVSGKAACGTAVHETIARALTNPDVVARMLAGPGVVDAKGIRKVFELELEREIGGRDVEWYDDDCDSIKEDRVAMMRGLFDDLHKHVESIELIEAGFIVKLGDYWLSGHTDIVYRPKGNPTGLALADWKTGASKPDQIELDHGWESGVYSAAMERGYFLPREDVYVEQRGPAWYAACRGCTATHLSRYIAERDAIEGALILIAQMIEHGEDPATLNLRHFGAFPDEIRHVHLADYVPYKKAGSKEAKRPEDLAFYGIANAAKVKYVAGDRRGPAWLPVRRSEHDVPRLEHRLRTIVGMIRMGWFVDEVGEKCKRCAFASDCLNTGYQARGNELVQLKLTLRGLDKELDGLGV